MLQVSGRRVTAARERTDRVRRPSAGGSYAKLFRPGRGLVVVPEHGTRPLPPGTLRRILAQAGLTEDELRGLL